MRVIEIKEKDYVLPLCADATLREMELVRFKNTGDRKLFLRVHNTVLKYGILPGGSVCCTLCGGEFVAAIRTVQCWGRSVRIRDSLRVYQYDQEGVTYSEDSLRPVYRGRMTLYGDGSVDADGYHWPLSPKGNPFVYADGSVGVDSRGFLMFPADERLRDMENHSCIQGAGGGEAAITADRNILIRGERTWDRKVRPVDMRTCPCGYLVLTHNGGVYFSGNGRTWKKVADEATAIAARDHDIAFARKDGQVQFLRYGDKNELEPLGESLDLGKRISRMDMSREYLACLFTDCDFDVLLRESGHSICF